MHIIGSCTGMAMYQDSNLLIFFQNVIKEEHITLQIVLLITGTLIISFTGMATMIVNILTQPKDRGQNKACYGIAEDLRILEITIIQNQDTAQFSSKLQEGKFVVLQQYSINEADGATYVRLTSGKSKVQCSILCQPEHLPASYTVNDLRSYFPVKIPITKTRP